MPKLSNKPWGSVDKNELLKYVIDHPDKAKDIYMKIGKNWQEDPYNRLSYPIADKNGTVYRYGLSSALAYAKANNETEVVSKVKKLYKKYGIREEGIMRKIIEAYVYEGEEKSYKAVLTLNIKDGDGFEKGGIGYFPYDTTQKSLKYMGSIATVEFTSSDSKTKVTQKIKDWAYQYEDKLFNKSKCRIKKVEVR